MCDLTRLFESLLAEPEADTTVVEDRVLRSVRLFICFQLQGLYLDRNKLRALIKGHLEGKSWWTSCGNRSSLMQKCHCVGGCRCSSVEAKERQTMSKFEVQSKARIC